MTTKKILVHGYVRDFFSLPQSTSKCNLMTASYNPDGAYDNAAYNAEPAPAWADPHLDWDPNRAWDDTVYIYFSSNYAIMSS